VRNVSLCKATAFFIECPSIDAIFLPRPVFSHFSILEGALLRLRLQNRFGLGQGRNLLCLDGYYFIILPFFVVPLNDTIGRWPEITAG
jgi:hypothetical protein